MPAATCADEVAYWVYSSGTTGNPKGVMHVHSTPRLVSQLIGAGLLGLRDSDVSFSAAKMFFSYGLCNSIFCPMGAGATTVLYPERPTPRTVFEMLHSYQPSVFYAVPTLYASVLGDMSCTPRSGSQRLRLCFSAGEPLPPELGVAWRARFGLDIINGVGSTGDGTPLPDQPSRPRSSTAPPACRSTAYDVRLVDEHGHEVADGEIGELLVRGQTAAAGYWNQRDEDHARPSLASGRAPGTSTCGAADGVYVYCGRTDDMFKVSGIWVSPFEVEAALDRPSARARGRRVPPRTSNGLIKPKAFVVLKDRRDDLPEPRAVRGAQGAREAQHRSVEISALDRVRRQPAPDGDRQAAAPHAARQGRRQFLVIGVQVESRIATLTLQRPPVNAISSEWLALFQRMLDELAARDDWQVLHLRTAQKVFCAGADLAEMRARLGAADGLEHRLVFVAGMQRLFARIEALPQVTLAEIGGAALGGGLELALACDLRDRGLGSEARPARGAPRTASRARAARSA